MIARSPEWWSWQKTTCSWPVGPRFCPWAPVSPTAPFSWPGIANTLVTVATLLVPSRILVDPGSEPSVLPALDGPHEPRRLGREAFPQPSASLCGQVTGMRDHLVTLASAFVGFWYVTIRQ
jgi:hypothetical protein